MEADEAIELSLQIVAAVDALRPGTVNLTRDDARAAYYCAAAVIRRRQRTGQPIPEWLRKHFKRLDTAIRASESGHQSDSGAEQSEWITAASAAVILGISKRQAQRIAPDLDGRIIGGRWLFPPDAVKTYAEGRQHA